jgi:pilus assembly protein CpaB
VVDKKECKRTKVLLPRVQVLAVGSDSAGTDGARGSTPAALGGATRSGNPSLLITVAVSPADGPRLVLAAETGSLYLGLLSGSVEELKTGMGVDCREAPGDPAPLFP